MARVEERSRSHVRDTDDAESDAPRATWRRADGALAIIRLTAGQTISGSESGDDLRTALTAVTRAVEREDGDLISLGVDYVAVLFEGRGAAVRATWAARHIRGDDTEPAGLLAGAGIHAGTFTVFDFGTEPGRSLTTGSDASTGAGLCRAAEPGQIVVSEAMAGHLPQSSLGEPCAGGRELGVLTDDVIDLRATISGTGVSPDTDPTDARDANGRPPPEHETATDEVGETTVARVHVHATDRMLHDEGPYGLGDALAGLVDAAEELAQDRDLLLTGPELRPDGVVLTLATHAGAAPMPAEELGKAVKPLVALHTGLPIRTGIASGLAFRGPIAPELDISLTVAGPAVDLADDRARHTTGDHVTSASSDREAPHVEALRAAIADSADRLVVLDVEGGSKATADLVHGTLLTEDVPATTVRCYPLSTASPWWGAAQLVRAALDLGDEHSPDDAQRAVTQTAPQVLRWLPLFAPVLGCEIPDNGLTELLSPPFRRERTCFVVTELLREVWPGRHALVVEGADDLDDSSAAMLELLAARAGDHPWLIVRIAHGPPAIPRVGPGGGDVRGSTERRSLVGPDTHTDDAEVARQIEALPTQSRRLLRTASLLGPTVERHLLVELALEDPSLDLEALPGLIGEYLVADGPDTLRFVDAAVARVADDGVQDQERQEISGGIAEALQRRGHPDADEIRIGHLLAAKRLRETWTIAIRVADRATDSAADLEAALLYDVAIRAARGLDDGAVDVASAWEVAGDARMRAGQLHAAAAAYAEARRRAEPGVVVQARLLQRHAAVALAEGRHSAAIRWLQRGARLLADSADGDEERDQESMAEHARLSLAMSEVRAYQDRFDEAAHWARTAIARSEEAGERHTRARAYEALDRAYLAMGDLDRARHSVFALAVYEELDDLTGQAHALETLARIARLDGRPTGAVRLLQRAAEAREALGDVRGAAAHQVDAARILLDEGELPEVNRLLRDARSTFESYFDRAATDDCNRVEHELRDAVQALSDSTDAAAARPPPS